MWPETHAKVGTELSLLNRLLHEYRDLFSMASRAEPAGIEVLALSALLHSFYTGVENVFKRIADEIDGSIPSGGRYHAQLASQMAQPLGARPAVISRDLRNRLGEYLEFRHVFRYAYSFNLDWAKMSRLVIGCEETLRLLEAELAEFFGSDNDEHSEA